MNSKCTGIGATIALGTMMLLQSIVANADLISDAAKTLTSTDPTIVNGLYHHPDRYHGGKISPDGAMSENIQYDEHLVPTWSIERQRYGADYIQSGVATHDERMIDTGIKILDWGWAQQAPDGSFPGSDGGYHVVTMFVEAGARALILLKAYDPVKYANTISSESAHLRKAVDYLHEPDVTERGNDRDRGFTHRRYLVAALYAESAAVLGDNTLNSWADAKAVEGLGLQTPEGVNPEQHGFDITYQSFGLTLAYRYMQVCDDPSLKGRVQAMFEKGIVLVDQHVDSMGNLITEDSTRTGKEHSAHGAHKVKGPDFRIVIQALSYAADLTGNNDYRTVAHSVAVAKGWVN